MKVVTEIEVPDYVYQHFLKEAEPWARKTAEDMMAFYLARYVRQKQYRQAKKQEQTTTEQK